MYVETIFIRGLHTENIHLSGQILKTACALLGSLTLIAFPFRAINNIPDMRNDDS